MMEQLLLTNETSGDKIITDLDNFVLSDGASDIDILLHSGGLSLKDIEKSLDLQALISSGDISAKDDGGNDISNIETLFVLSQIHNEPVTTIGMFALANKRVGEIHFNTTIQDLVYWDNSNWRRINGELIYQVLWVDNFDSGSLATKGWVKVDGGENDWEIGTAEKFTGTHAIYISNDSGTTNAYTSVGGQVDVSHIYIDIPIPTGTSDIYLEFDWKCEGEVGYDGANVFNKTTSFTPSANTEITGDQIGLWQYNDKSIWQHEQIPIPIEQAGTTRRFCVSWKNDSSVENQPPICIDNFKITGL